MTSPDVVDIAKRRRVKIDEVGELVDKWDSSLPREFKRDLFGLLADIEGMILEIVKGLP